MKTNITHSGVVERIEGDHITVRILQVSGCSSCKMAGHCYASESSVKQIDVYGADSSHYQVGDNVTVSADLSTGYKAVAWGFGIPLVLLVATIFAIRAWTSNDGVAALAGIAALIPYYILLYCVRDKLREKFSFTIQ